MTMPLLQPVLVGLAVGAALEVVLLRLRRYLPRRSQRLRYHLWALAVAVVAFYSFGGHELLMPAVLDVAAFVVAVLTVDLGYGLFNRGWLARPGAEGRQVVPRLMRDLGGVVAVFAAVVVAGHYFLDIPYEKFLLPSAVVSAVLGLALQDVLKNVFAGLALQTELPFEMGDWILVDGEPMQVVEVALRTTHLRTSLGIHVREPNAKLTDSRIVCLGRGIEPMGFAVRVGVAYGAPPGLVRRSLERAARTSLGVAAEPPPVALVHAFAESAVEYEVRFWTREVYRLARVHDAVRSRIWYQLHRDGWKIPFPMRTVEVEPARAIAADKRRWRSARAEELFARLDLFAALAPEVRRRLAESALLRYYDSGERLVSEGDQGDSLLVLGRGSVLVEKTDSDGGAQHIALATLSEGEYVGEMSLLTGEPRSATVSAQEPCEVFILERRHLAPVLEQDPELAETLSRVLAERRQATSDRVADRRDRRPAVAREQQTLLHRIRDFFKLG